MPAETTYKYAQKHLKALMDEVVNDRTTVIVRRSGDNDVALIAADDLRSLEETAYLLRSPENARRLLTALNRAKSRKGKPKSIRALKREVGLEE
jgi:antitoxin YefM